MAGTCRTGRTRGELDGFVTCVMRVDLRYQRNPAPRTRRRQRRGVARLLYIYIIYANALKQMFLLDLGTSVGVIRFQRQRRRVCPATAPPRSTRKPRSDGRDHPG